jgi:nickel/cobalt transporter (NicO) family protein
VRGPFAGVAGLVALALALIAPSPATAHPLGNFSINRLDLVSISRDRVDIRYLLDQAEIPTFQQRGTPAARVLARTRRAVTRGLTLEADGRRVALRPIGAGAISHPAGQGGLPTTRIELRLSAAAPGPRRVVLRDATFAARVGWKAVVVVPGRGTAVRSSVPAHDPTGRLRRYPRALLASPPDTRVARFAVTPGAGTVAAPDTPAPGAGPARGGVGDGLTAAFERAAAGHGVLLVLVLSAFGWGMVHALSPGHGKAMVAAYLVGTRGTARHALALGLTVTVTHTAGVFALGVVTLALSQYVLPEQLYPWLNLASGLLVVAVGAAVLRARIRSARAAARDRHHDHGDHHRHDADGHHRHHGDGPHGHDHHHHPVTTRGLLAMGASAGLIPCPSALVVLLAAIAQHQVALGLALILAFSTGLATTLVALGVLVVSASSFARRLHGGGWVATVVPAASAAAILTVGLVLTVQALPEL